MWRVEVATVLALGLGGVGSGCGSEPEQTAATEYRLRIDRVVGPQRQTDQRLVRESVAETAGPARWFSADQGPELPTEVRYASLVEADGVPVLRVELEVDAPSELRAGLAPDMSATIELTRTDGAVQMGRDLPVALERAVAILDARMTLARGTQAERTGVLADEDPEIVVLALDWVEARRARDMADAVVGLVGHEDARIALRAVECIGVVGSPEHARHLVVRPRTGDRAHANRLYEALANLGGDDAAGFLEFAARNEDDPAMAELAQRALTRVRAHPQGSEPPAVWVAGRGHRGAAEGT